MAKIAELMGSPLFPWQRYVADVALEVDESGAWVYDEVVVTVPRRSGKTFMIKPVTAHRCGAGPVSAWITAQKRHNAVNRWRDAAEGLMATPLRSDLRFRSSGSQEVLGWRSTGASFRPFAPREDAMHGEDPDLVWVDELWAFSTEQRRVIEQGYRPSWSVRSGQAWLLSTAGTARSEWLNAVRRQGRNAVEGGSRVRRAFFEWSVPESAADLGDGELVDLVIGSHPRRDRGLRHEFVAGELESMGRPDFMRAYGNVTRTEDEPSVFAPAVMERARSGDRIPGDARISFGVSVDEDRREASIGLGWRNASGVAVTDEMRADGTRWVAGEVIRLVDQYDVGQVAIVAAGPGRNVADELERAGVPLLRLSRSDHAAACSGFGDEFSADRPSVTWNGSNDFASAVAAAEVRRKPSGLVWESRTGAPVTALDARALAVWAADHAPEPAQKFGWVAY